MRVVFGVLCDVGVLVLVLGWGRQGWGCVQKGGAVCWVVFVRGLRPVPPCFWSVGGGAPVCEGR